MFYFALIYALGFLVCKGTKIGKNYNRYKKKRIDRDKSFSQKK